MDRQLRIIIHLIENHGICTCYRDILISVEYCFSTNYLSGQLRSVGSKACRKNRYDIHISSVTVIIENEFCLYFYIGKLIDYSSGKEYRGFQGI